MAAFKDQYVFSKFRHAQLKISYYGTRYTHTKQGLSLVHGTIQVCVLHLNSMTVENCNKNKSLTVPARAYATTRGGEAR